MCAGLRGCGAVSVFLTVKKAETPRPSREVGFLHRPGIALSVAPNFTPCLLINIICNYRIVFVWVDTPFVEHRPSFFYLI